MAEQRLQRMVASTRLFPSWQVIVDGQPVGFVIGDKYLGEWTAWLYRKPRNWKLGVFSTRREAADEVWIYRDDAEVPQ